MNKKLNNNKTKRSLITVVVVMGIILVLAIFELINTNSLNTSSDPSPKSARVIKSQSPTPTPEVKEKIENGVYTNYTYGFRFEYPNDILDIGGKSKNFGTSWTIGFFSSDEAERLRPSLNLDMTLLLTPQELPGDEENFYDRTISLYPNEKFANGYGLKRYNLRTNGIPGVVYDINADVWNVTEPGILYRAEWKRDEIIYRLTMLSDSDNFSSKKDRNLFDMTVASLEFFNPENPPKEVPKFDSDKMD